MKLILLGAPGAGKGTQATKLSQKLSIPHISTGDIFRNNIKNSTELGKKAKEYIDKGMLVPDELTISIVKDRLMQDDCKNGFILDGFPRTIPQAEYLEKALNEMGTDIDHVVNVSVADEEIIKRMSGRRVCTNCGATFHTVFNPTKKDGICDNCNASVIQRDDDKEETVISRLKTYHEQTEPLIGFYSKRGKLLTVIGREEIEETSKAVIKVLGV
ncbi:MAG TPA: adenylate kinase [Pseudobacteroides sp.]|uniref:adenylate kinase n=1 Tax=Pseudobacteroides sp. TaxID=1968840 RepID=UPI002F924E44